MKLMRTFGILSVYGLLAAHAALLAKPPVPAVVAQVEVKFLIQGEADVSKALKAFKLEQLPPKKETVCFFDTEKQDLFKRARTLHDLSVILRVRLSVFKDGKEKAETTVKLRARGEPLSSDLQTDKDKDAKREKDWVLKAGAAGTAIESYSMDNEPPPADAAKVIDGSGDPGILLSGPQRELFQSHVTSGIKISDLRRYGPVKGVRVWKNITLEGEEFSRPLTFEHWLLPAREGRAAVHLLEASVKVAEPDSPNAAQSLIDLMSRHDIHLKDDAEAKTRLVLEHFSQ